LASVVVIVVCIGVVLAIIIIVAIIAHKPFMYNQGNYLFLVDFMDFQLIQALGI
jgi:hypothetical protein